MTERRQPADATAQTLNHVLGNLGGKQKSWMVGASVSHPVPVPAPAASVVAKRPRGRPRKYFSDTNLVQVPAHLTQSVPSHSAARTDSQAPSNLNYSEPADFPNLPPHHKHTEHGPEVIILSSPTLPDNNGEHIHNWQQRQPQAHRVTSELPHNVSSPAVSSNVRTTTDSTAPTASVDPHGARLGDTVYREVSTNLKRPLTDAAQESDERMDIDTVLQQKPMAALTEVRSTSSRPLTQLESSLPLVHPLSQAPRTLSLTGVQGNSHLSQGSSSVSTGQSLAVPFVQQEYRPPPTCHSPVMMQSSQVQSTMHNPNAWISREFCLEKIDRFKASHPTVSRYPRDTVRLSVLRDAADQQDWAYLAMHQFYCAMNGCPQNVPTAVRQHPCIRKAHEIMHNILDSNEHISPALFSFFIEFPMPLWALAAEYCVMFQHQVHLFVVMLGQIGHFEELRSICKARRFPPLANELADDLAIASPTFRRLVFTACLRGITKVPPQDASHKQFESQAIAIYQQNQIAFQQRKAQSVGLHPADPRLVQAADSERLFWAAQLQRLMRGHASQRPVQPVDQLRQYSTNRSPQQLRFSQGGMLRRVSGPVGVQEAPNPMPSGWGQTQRNHQQHLLVQQKRTANQKPQKLLPPRGFVLAHQRQPNPTRFSLHQAHLRSPVLKTRFAPSPFYHFLQDFAIPPTRFTEAGRALERWTFNVTPAIMEHLVKPSSAQTRGPGVLPIDRASKTARLRCIKWDGAQSPTEHEWAIADTTWVPYSYFTLNGKALELRRKVHHGKDLPVDITGLLKKGENVLEITVMALSTEASYLTYVTAVEILGVQSHENIIQQCLNTNRMSKDEVVQQIKNKLSTTANDDDEIAIVESNITISLIDPFSGSNICKVPVRSRACLHHDGFELETFLRTRSRKGDASVPDQWRCPICGADARPQYLFIDEFLEHVHEQLQSTGLTETRAIIVQQDGSWKPKVETRDPNGVSDHSPSPTPACFVLPAHAEIIDLSD